MSVELAITAEAERDITEAFTWYEDQRAGLGEEFLTCLDASLQGLKRMPEIHTIAYRTFRRALVRRFPYAVFYEIEDERVVVYSGFHTAQDPGKWRRRLQ